MVMRFAFLFANLSRTPLCNSFSSPITNGGEGEGGIMIYFFIKKGEKVSPLSRAWLCRAECWSCLWMSFSMNITRCHPISEFRWCLNALWTQVTLFINKIWVETFFSFSGTENFKTFPRENFQFTSLSLAHDASKWWQHLLQLPPPSRNKTPNWSILKFARELER